MVLKVYNTATREVEVFKPLVEGKVGMYVCGVTTYDLCHMGHARAYVAFDVIRRYLEYKGYEVNFVQNFTDVDDKIIQRSREKGVEPLEFAQQYIDEYFKDMDMLGVLRATHYPLASENIEGMIDLIRGLMDKGFAYNVKGNVYFSIYKALERVGQLTHQPLDEMLDGARVEINPEKDHPKDFALWKRAKKGEISWDSPWGKGRPGWHIECSTMSMKYIGETLDIHGGGQDLIFPHHESEILQSECLTDKKFSRYWIHNGFVTINQEKMSKSLDNFFTVREIFKKYSPAVVRFFLLYTHYRQPVDYSDQHLEEAKKSLKRILTTVSNVERYLGDARDESMPRTGGDVSLHKNAECKESDFIRSMDEDFNTRNAIAAIFELGHDINRSIGIGVEKEMIQSAYNIYKEMLEVLGLSPEIISRSMSLGDQEQKSEREDKLINLLIELRAAIRKEKLWHIADLIRDRLNEMDIVLEDAGESTIYKRKM